MHHLLSTTAHRSRPPSTYPTLPSPPSIHPSIYTPNPSHLHPTPRHPHHFPRQFPHPPLLPQPPHPKQPPYNLLIPKMTIMLKLRLPPIRHPRRIHQYPRRHPENAEIAQLLETQGFRPGIIAFRVFSLLSLFARLVVVGRPGRRAIRRVLTQGPR